MRTDGFSLNLNDYRVEPKREQYTGMCDIGTKAVNMLVETKIPLEENTRCMAVGCDEAATVQYHIQVMDQADAHNVFVAIDFCQAHEYDLSVVLVPR